MPSAFTKGKNTMHSTPAPLSLPERLRAAGILPTRQRLAIAQVLLQQPVHMCADEVLLAARKILPTLSRATVYNTLPVMVQGGLLRALRMDAERMIYDSRVEAHSHIYHEDTGMVQDLDASELSLPHIPSLPSDLEVVGYDLIVRVRKHTTH